MEIPVEHLREKYFIFSLQFENGLARRMIMVHVGRPLSFRTFAEKYVLQHVELTIQRTNEKLEVNKLVGIQKIPNDNLPAFELTMDGNLIEIRG